MKNTKNKRVIGKAAIIAVVALLIISIGIETAYALPEKTVKINGKLFDGEDFYFSRPDVPYAKPRVGNTIALEIKAKWVGGSLTGSGSLHGINCHSTFFFDDLTGDIEDGVLTLTGTVTSTSTPFKDWIGTAIQLVTDLSGEDMHFIIWLDFGVFLYPLDFGGSGQVVL